MSEYYIEIEEDIGTEEIFKPLEILRRYVKDEAEAELVYSQEVSNFSNTKTKAKFIEMNHDVDPSKNKPCIEKEMKDGKIQS